jgi:uncharacterized membrane protein YhaH (DUF805 family)
MEFELVKIKSAGIAAFRSLFGGRIARTTFAIRVAILVAVVVILAAPFNTILAPSSKTLRDAYLALSLCVFALCLIGIVSAYVKRLHDMGLRGYWALAFLILLPMAIIGLGALYIDHRYNSDHSYNTAELVGLIGNVALIAPFLIAMWRGEKVENRFGPVPDPVEHVGASKFNIAAAVGAAAILIPTSIYAGLFQSGVWVGRGDMAPSMPLMESNVPGTRFMKCWNVKGVGAGSGEGPGSGVYRDGYTGNLFDFLVTPTGQIDIAMAGERGGNSFVADGFRIVPYGLKLPADGSGYVNVRGLDRFMLVAIFDQGGPGAAINYTTFTFGRNKDTWPEYHVVMTSALSSSANATDLAKFPEARGRLMIGDCVPG